MKSVHVAVDELMHILAGLKKERGETLRSLVAKSQSMDKDKKGVKYSTINRIIKGIKSDVGMTAAFLLMDVFGLDREQTLRKIGLLPDIITVDVTRLSEYQRYLVEAVVLELEKEDE